MVKITIIGWYGTETIGDRAILAGLIHMLGESFDEFELSIGALYPVLTERTILEDGDFWRRCCDGKLKNVTLFDSTVVRELRESIKWCDLLAVGGGPLMDIEGMYMLDYAFSYAAKKKKKTALLGCGWGPLHNTELVKCAVNLIKKSNLCLYRDNVSLTESLKHVPAKFAVQSHALVDPAFIAAQQFLKQRTSFERDELKICVNLRDLSYDEHYKSDGSIDEKLKKMLTKLSETFDREILLVPMHTFAIGGDDRIYLNKLHYATGKRENIIVQNIPLSLEQTMSEYFNSYFCVGMRFHSTVIQSLLSGKNFILDYTDPAKGKIISMMNTLGIADMYKGRYCSLMTDEIDFDFTAPVQRNIIKDETIEKYRTQYIKYISQILDK